MKIVATLYPVDTHGCREVEFEIQGGGDNGAPVYAYKPGTLYMREEHAEMWLRTLGGHSFGFVGEVEVVHSEEAAPPQKVCMSDGIACRHPDCLWPDQPCVAEAA